MRSIQFLLPLLAAAMSLLAPQASAATTKTVYDFCSSANCDDGISPRGVVMDASGTLYGTTANGGGGRGQGTVYSLTPNGDGTWTHKILYSFCTAGRRRCADGASPLAPLIIDVNGALYGTTYAGGKANSLAGTVFRLSPNADRTVWTLTTLRSFCIQNDGCAEGMNPDTGLTYAGQKDGLPYDGSSPLYGIAHGGAPDFGACQNLGCGLIYKVFPKSNMRWGYLAIYRFCPQHDQCADGRDPQGELVALDGGTLIGTTSRGGAHGDGTVFEIKKVRGQKLWNESIIYSMCPSDCSDGTFPASGVMLGQNGDIWSTATGGGAKHQAGTLFKVDAAGTETTLHSFCIKRDCPDGRAPSYLLMDGAGDIFGSTTYGGGNDGDPTHSGGGVLFRQSGSTNTTLYAFCAQANCADGANPTSPLVFGPGGKIYGTTAGGGAHGGGTVYELTP